MARNKLAMTTFKSGRMMTGVLVICMSPNCSQQYNLSVNVGKGSEFIQLTSHFLLDFGDLDESFSLGNGHASMALRSLNHDYIVHAALVLVLRLVG